LTTIPLPSQATDTLSLVQQQHALELEAQEYARERFKLKVQQDEARAYCSATPYGKVILDRTLEAVTLCITKQLSKIAAGHPSEYGAELEATKLHEFPPEKLALIACKTLLDMAKLPIPKNSFTAIVRSIGNRAYHEMCLILFEKAHPQEMTWAIRDHNKLRKGYTNRWKDFQARFKDVEWEPPRISQQTAVHLGAWLLNRFQEVTDGKYIDEQIRWLGKKKVVLLFTTSHFDELRLGILALRTPFRSPNLNRSTLQEALADFPRLAFRLEADLDLRSDGLTVRRIATRKPVGGVVPDEEGGAHRFQQRRLTSFVGLDDDVEPVGQPVEHEGVAVFAEV
jgi:hypothetical protein